MHPQRRNLFILNVLGGAAVLGSYAHGIATHAEPGRALWGGIPEAWRGPYSACMPVAAVGYLLFWSLLNFRVDPERARAFGRPALPVFTRLLALVLGTSALWMPLTFAYVDAPSAALWALIRLGLGTTGLGALGLIAALLSLRPREPRLHYWLAVAGSVGFAWQTAVLDALVWPAFFPR